MNLLPALLTALQAQTGLQVAVPLDPEATGTTWMPLQGSTIAPDIDWVFYYIYWISVVFTAIIVGVMIFFALRYRHRKGVWDGEKSASHGLLLEITWSVIPFLLTIVMWWQGVDTFMKAETVPEPGKSMEVKVLAQQWGWEFTYDNGMMLPNELHIPAGEPVTFVMRSKDVIHSFFVPAWRVKKDVVPGRYTKVWVNATEPGEYTLFCTEYCGLDHSNMMTRVVVHPTREQLDAYRERGLVIDESEPDNKPYDEWMEVAAAEFLDRYKGLTQVEIGEKVYRERTCMVCHSVDGSVLVGPSWQGIWGTERQFVDGGSATVDENYIRQSILDPNSQLVEGYPNGGMVSFAGQLSDEEIDGVIAYIKDLGN